MKKTKEPSPPPKPSSFAALESHAKEILSKMDQQKKPKVKTFQQNQNVSINPICEALRF